MLGTALLCVCFLGGKPEVGASEDQDAVARRSAIVEALQLDEPPELSNPESMTAELAGLESANAIELVEIVAAEGIPEGWQDGQPSFRSLDAERLAAVREALALVPLPALREAAASISAVDPRLKPREVALELFAERGEARDLLVVQHLVALEPAAQPGRSLERTLEKTLFALVERDATGLSELDEVFERVHPALRIAVVDALVRFRSKDALCELASLLERHAELDSHVLWGIVRLASKLTPPLPEVVLPQVRSYLFSTDRVCVQAAARACGLLDDVEAIPFLLELLDETDENLVSSAQRALSTLTQLGYGSDSCAWWSWFEGEERWWAESAPALLDDLASSEPVLTLKAITELSGHRLHKNEIALALSDCLERTETELVLLACEGLRQLDSCQALPALIPCLEHPDGNVRQAAWTALRAITRKDLPPEREFWLALL